MKPRKPITRKPITRKREADPARAKRMKTRDAARMALDDLARERPTIYVDLDPNDFDPPRSIAEQHAEQDARNRMVERAIDPKVTGVTLDGVLVRFHGTPLGRLTPAQGVGSVGAANLGCNYGGATASIALVNGYTFNASLVAQPIKIDLWLNEYGTQGKALNGWLQGRLEVNNTPVTTNSSATIMNAAVDSSTTPVTPNTLTCTWVWGSAAATNSLVITNGKLIIGD